MAAIQLALVVLGVSNALASSAPTFRPPHGPPRLGRRPPPLLFLSNTTASSSVDRLTIEVKSIVSNVPVVWGLTSAMLLKGLRDVFVLGHSNAHRHGTQTPNLLHTTVLYSISHADLIHFLVNLGLVHAYGTHIERRCGSRRLSALLASVVLGGGLLNLAGCARFGHCQGKGSSGISMALLSAFECGRALRSKKSHGAWAFAWGCLGLLALELALLGPNLSLRIHLYGLVAGALFAICNN